jgi:cobalt-zinc-cadmium efflux system protein
VVGGVLIWAFQWYWADPAVSILIGLLVIFSSVHLLKESVAVLMEGAPGHIDVDEVRRALLAVPGVREVSDLHIWSITTGPWKDIR